MRKNRLAARAIVGAIAALGTLAGGLALAVPAMAVGPDANGRDAASLANQRDALRYLQELNRLRTGNRPPITGQQAYKAYIEDFHDTYSPDGEEQTLGDDGKPVSAVETNQDMMAWAQARADELAARGSLDSHADMKNGAPSWARDDSDSHGVNDHYEDSPDYHAHAIVTHPHGWETDTAYAVNMWGPEALAQNCSDPISCWASERDPGKTGQERQGYGHYMTEVSPYPNVAGMGVAEDASGNRYCVLEMAYDGRLGIPNQSVDAMLADVGQRIAALPDTVFDSEEYTRTITLHEPDGDRTVTQTATLRQAGKTREDAAWRPATFPAYPAPRIDGWTASPAVVPALTVTTMDAVQSFADVAYTKNQPDKKPDKPVKPTDPGKKPDRPSKPVDPAKPGETEARRLAASNRDALEDGTYVASSALGAGLVLDVQGGSRSDGGNVQLYSANGTRAQEWAVSHDADGFVILRNASSGRVLDLSAAIARNGRNIDQWDGNGTDAQKWVAVKTGNGIVLHSAVDPAYVLDVAGGARRNGANVQLYRANGTMAQAWAFGQTPEALAEANRGTMKDGPMVLRSGLGSNLVLDMAGGSRANGGNVQLYSANGTAAQEWTASHDPAGFVTLTNRASGKVLDLSAAIARNGRNIDQWEANGTMAQKWVAVRTKAGIVLHSAISPAYVLDVAGGARRNGANVQLYQANGTPAQAWAPSPTSGQLAAARADRLAAEYRDVLADGEYTLYSRVDDTPQHASYFRYVLDVAGGSHANGANVRIWENNGTSAQKWAVTHDAKGYAMFRSLASGRMLDLSAAIACDGRNIDQWEQNDTRAQKWIVQPNAHGVTLRSAVDPGYVLDVAGGRKASGTNVQLYRSNGTAAQSWSLMDKDGYVVVDGGYHHWHEG